MNGCGWEHFNMSTLCYGRFFSSWSGASFIVLTTLQTINVLDVFNDIIFAEKPPPQWETNHTEVRATRWQVLCFLKIWHVGPCEWRIVILAQHSFIALVQRIFNCGEIQNNGLTPKCWTFWYRLWMIPFRKHTLYNIGEPVSDSYTWRDNLSSASYSFTDVVQRIFNYD